ncbi:MAG: hypothetical protein L3K13_04335 [Thermoplasmata archaeon]|nr:hypothetical protein [Thermoplasmata archaeon]
MGVDPSGASHPLSESLVLATILCAIDGERARPTFVWSRPEEVVEAVASVYWPVLVVPSPVPGRVVIFDGAGVWRQSFRRSRLPSLQELPDLLAKAPPSGELAAWLRHLRAPFLPEPATDVLTIEGLLPAGLPLLSDILTQSTFRTEPIYPHAGFLPPRRPIGWYESAAAQLGASLQSIDTDLAEAIRVRSAVEGLCTMAYTRLENERRQLQFDLSQRSRFYARAEMDREAEGVSRSLREQIFGELDRVRSADAAIAEARASAELAAVLAERGSARGKDVAELRNRMRTAAESERRSGQESRKARLRIAALHERERSALGVLTDRVAVVETRIAKDLAAHELLRDEVQSAGSDLLAALDAHIQRQMTDRQALGSHLLSVPALEGVRTLWLPLWIATLAGPSYARCVVFPPMRVRSGVGVSDSIRTLFGGVVLPLEPRTAEFGQGLRTTMEAAIASDPWLFGVTRQIVRAADLTSGPEFLQRLALGLGELRQAGWISPEHERRYFELSSHHLRSRPMGGSFSDVRSPYDGPPGSPQGI